MRRLYSAALGAAVIALAGALWTTSAFAATNKGRKMCSTIQINGFVTKEKEKGVFKVVKKNFYAAAAKQSGLSVFKNEGKHFKGTDAIIEFWNANYGFEDTRWLAYILATALHESRLHPVREHFGKTDEDSIRKLRAWASRHRSANIRNNVYKYTTPDKTTGHAYFGRGFVQLTWAANYQKADRWLGIVENDLGQEKYRAQSYYWNPVFQLQPKDSVRTLYSGMVYGWYRNSHCLLRYIYPKETANFVHARNIVNGGLDKASRIRGYADAFYRALKSDGVVVKDADFVAIAIEEPEKKVEEKKKEEVKELISDAKKKATGGASPAAIKREVDGQREVFAKKMVELETALANEKGRGDALSTRMDAQQEEIASLEDQIERLSLQLTEAKVERDRIAAQSARQTELLEQIARDVRQAKDRTFWDYLFGSGSEE